MRLRRLRRPWGRRSPCRSISTTLAQDPLSWRSRRPCTCRPTRCTAPALTVAGTRFDVRTTGGNDLSLPGLPLDLTGTAQVTNSPLARLLEGSLQLPAAFGYFSIPVSEANRIAVTNSGVEVSPLQLPAGQRFTLLDQLELQVVDAALVLDFDSQEASLVGTFEQGLATGGRRSDQRRHGYCAGGSRRRHSPLGTDYRRESGDRGRLRADGGFHRFAVAAGGRTRDAGHALVGHRRPGRFPAAGTVPGQRVPNERDWNEYELEETVAAIVDDIAAAWQVR